MGAKLSFASLILSLWHCYQLNWMEVRDAGSRQRCIISSHPLLSAVNFWGGSCLGMRSLSLPLGVNLYLLSISSIIQWYHYHVLCHWWWLLFVVATVYILYCNLLFQRGTFWYHLPSPILHLALIGRSLSSSCSLWLWQVEAGALIRRC